MKLHSRLIISTRLESLGAKSDRASLRAKQSTAHLQFLGNTAKQRCSDVRLMADISVDLVAEVGEDRHRIGLPFGPSPSTGPPPSRRATLYVDPMLLHGLGQTIRLCPAYVTTRQWCPCNLAWAETAGLCGGPAHILTVTRE